jgi:hypothetical protein
MISAYDQTILSTPIFLHVETNLRSIANVLEEVFSRPSFSSFQDRFSAMSYATLVSEHEGFLVSKFVAPLNYDHSISSP